MENPRHIIINCLKKLQNRVQIQSIFQQVTTSVFVCLCILVVLYIGSRLVELPFSITFVTLLMIGLAVLFGVFLGLRHRLSLFDMAGVVDQKMQLKERISTSLELINGNRQGEIEELQITDSAGGIANLDATKIMPYVVPYLLKWVSIPIVVIALSFAVPYQYDLPIPLSDAEHDAIEKAINNLSDGIEDVSNPLVVAEIGKAIEKLRSAKNAVDVQEQLGMLNSVVRKQQSELPDETAIGQATEGTEHFRGMDTGQLADELDKLSEQPELSPELRDQLAELFARLAERVPQGKLRQTLEEVQGKTVSPETLQEIADALEQATQLKLLEAQLIDSRKDIALASIETEHSSGGTASSDGAPGQETGNKEAQGSQVSGDTSDFTHSTNDVESNNDDDNTSKPLTGDDTPPLQDSGNELRLNSEPASETESTTRVFSGNVEDQGVEPKYMPFSDVVLAAQREYAQAIENNRIPVRYRSQIKAYLEAIARTSEK